MLSGVFSLISLFVRGRTFEEEQLRCVLGWILLLPYFLFLSWDSWTSFSTFVASPVLQYLPVHAVQTLAHAEGFSFEDSRKTAAPGVDGAWKKVGARSSRGLLKAPLLGSTLKFTEEVHPPP